MAQAGRDWRSGPEVTREQLAADLWELGLRPGSVVLVHSSLSGLGHVVGGADAVIDALLDCVTRSGTVLFPTLTSSPHDGPERPPRMDVRYSSCWTGRIPDTARRHPGARRSLHPTHSVVAIGAESERFTASHEHGTSPCDQRSPYYTLIRDGGYILLLGGVTQGSNTTLHCIEEVAGVPYHLQSQATECAAIDALGREHSVRNYLHTWRRPPGFHKVESVLAEAGGLRVGRVGQGVARLMDAAMLLTLLVPILREDPLYLLTDEARREFENDANQRNMDRNPHA